MDALTTLSQLGGLNCLIAMVGAHTFTKSNDSVTFKFKARARNGSNCVRITLLPSDTYRVEFLSLRGLSCKAKSTFSDIYNDNLKGLFESETGLYLSL